MNLICVLAHFMDPRQNKIIDKKKVLEITLENLLKVPESKVIIATEQIQDNKIFEDIAKKLNIDIFYGSKSILLRLIEAGKFFDSDIIVRVPGNRISVDIKLLHKMTSIIKFNDNLFSVLPSFEIPEFFQSQVFTLKGLEFLQKQNLTDLELFYPQIYFYDHSDQEFVKIIFSKYVPDESEIIDLRKTLSLYIPEGNDSPFLSGQLQVKTRYLFSIETIKKFSYFHDTILDIACGDGVGIESLYKNFPNAKIFGVDYDQKIVDNLNELYKDTNVKILKTDAQSFISQEKFDIVISYETIEHLQDPEKFLFHIKSVMKKNGFLFISTPKKREKYSVSVFPHHTIEWSNNEFISFLTKNGFEIVSQCGQDHFGRIQETISEFCKNQIIIASIIKS